MRNLALLFLLGLSMVLSGLSQGQHMLFHLLGAGQPIANFTTASQTVAEADGVWAGWSSNLSAWTKRRQILVDGVDGALTDFPVMIKLDSTRIDYAETQSAGQDLRFTNDAGTLLSYEIEKWDESGTSIVWVKVPTLSAYPTKSSIWMYYGNSSASDAQSPTTWDASFAKVMHLNGTAGSIGSGATISSSVGAAGTANNGGGGMSYATGQVANGVVLDGTDDWINIGSDASLNFGANTPLTVSVFFKTTDTSGPVVSFRSLATGLPIIGLYIGHNGGSAQYGKVNVLLRDSGGAAFAQITGPTINDDLWHHLVLSRNAGSIISLYVDGVSYGTASAAGTGGGITTTDRAIGSDRKWVADAANSASDRFFVGTVDQLEVSTVQRSADWIQASYLSARDELTTFRSEEAPTSGAAIITVQLNTPAQSTITIPYTVSGTATAGTDHSRVSGNLTINGGSSSGSLNTYVLRDNLVEGSETAILTLGAPTGASLGPDTVHTVTINDEVLSPPDAVDDSINITNFSAVTIPVLTNDTDVNGDTLTITAVTAPTAGTAVRVGKTIRYTPTQDFPATDSFTYTISDGRGGTDTATVTLNYQIPFTWIGSGADANWTTAANWLGGVVPGAGNTAYFNNQCTTYCNPQINAGISAAGLRMNTSFSGTITQVAPNTVTIGTGGWVQKAGTFVGATSDVTIQTSLEVSGGSFTSTSSLLRIGSAMTSRTILAVGAGATFAHNNGHVYFAGAQPGCVSSQVYTIDVDSSLDLYDVTFNGDWASMCGVTTYAGGVGDKLHVLNKLTQLYGVLGVDIDLDGNLEVVDGRGGSGTIALVGAGAQTYAYTAGRTSSLLINKSLGTVTPLGGTTALAVSKFTLQSGTFTAPSGTLSVELASTSTTLFLVSSSATYNGGTGTVSIYGAQPSCISNQTFTIDVPSGFGFHNLTLQGDNASACGMSQLSLVAGRSVTVNGALIHSGAGGIHGTFNLNGNFSSNATNANGGTAVLNFTGTGAQSVSSTSGSFPSGTVTINKSASTLTLSSTYNATSTGQTFTLQSGVFDLAGLNLNVNSLLTVGSGAKLLCNGGTVTAGSTSISGELSCGTSLGITWLGTAGDGLWTTAGNWTNNTIPGASDIAYFNSSCTNCNATTNGAVSVKGIVMASTYTGTLTQAAGNAITVGTSGWSQAGGTFTGANAAIAMSGPFALGGGSFTATSGTTSVSSSYTVSGSPTYTHNSGTLLLVGQNSASINLIPGTVTYNNVTFGGYQASFNLTGTMTVTGLLTLADTESAYTGGLNTGTVNAYGNVNFVNGGKGGTGLVRIVGNSNQTVTGVSTARIPSFEIASTGGVVSVLGTLSLARNYTYTSGTVDTGVSTFVFQGPAYGSAAIAPGAIAYNNVTFGGYQTSYTITGTMSVNGLLTLEDSDTDYPGGLNTGTVNAYGNVNFVNGGKGGTGLVRIVGNSNQTVTGVSTARIPSFEIASTGGVVSVLGTLSLARNYTYTSGTVDTGVSTFIFQGPAYGSAAIAPGAIAYNNVTFGGYQTSYTITGTMSVNGLLTLEDTYTSYPGGLDTGTVNAYGNVNFVNGGKSGTGLVRIAGSGNQTVTGVSTASIPNFEFASTGGVVSISGTLSLKMNYTYTSGTVDTGVSTFVFQGPAYGSAAIVPGAIAYNNVTFGGYQTSYTITGTMSVNGLLTLEDSYTDYPGALNTGAVNAYGNVNLSGGGKSGTATLSFLGATAATFNVGSSSKKPTGLISMNKSGGSSVTLLSAVLFSTAGQDLTVSAGILDLGGFDLTVPDVLTVSAGATLRCNGGIFTSASFANSGTVNCPGYSGYEFNWTGAAADSNWNTAGNWAGGVIPSASSVVVFNDSYCGANCNATMPASASIRGIKMESPYSGTITQATGFTFSVGNRGWTQAAGTFVGSNAALTISTLFNVTGGSFTSTSGTLSLSGATTTIGAGATFNHNGGSIVSTQYMGWSSLAQNFGGKTLNNLSYVGDGDVTFGSTVIVDGNLSVNIGGYSAAINGQVDVKGDMTVLNHEDPSRFKVRFLGANVQTVTTSGAVGDWSTRIGRPIIDKSGGSLTFNNNTVIYGIEHIAGSTTFASGYTTQIEHFIATDCWAVDTISPGPTQFGHVLISGCGPRSITGTLAASGNVGLNIGGTAAGLRNGKVQVGGNFTLTYDENYSSTTEIEMTGSTDTTMTAVAGQVNPGNLTINKTGGSKVTLLSNYIVRNSAADLRIASGTLDVDGKVLTIGNASGVDSVLTLESGTTLDLGGGSATYEALVNNGGSIVP